MRGAQVIAGLVVILAAGGFSTGARAQTASVLPAAHAPSATGTPIKAPPGFRDSCARLGWLCASDDPAAQAPDARPIDADRLLELAETVNRRVNRAVTQLSDPENYGVAEYWTLPVNGQGDCEDFVLQKYKDLLDAGVPARNLSVAIVLDRRGDNHAVLVLRHPSGDLVLDSLTSHVVPWHRSGYRFLAMQAAEDKSRWEIVAATRSDSAHLAMR